MNGLGMHKGGSRVYNIFLSFKLLELSIDMAYF